MIMKLHNGLDMQHLLKMLANTLMKEHEQWMPVHYKSTTGHMEIGGLHRDEVIGWLICINCRFHFTPETVALGVALTDKFLSQVKVRPKYIQCVAISCFYIAAKTLEEDEVIPSAVDLVKLSQCSCAVSDILRMELIILNKLQWSVKNVTQIDFLHIIHSLLMCYHPQLLEDMVNMTPSRHLSILSRNMFHCLCNHKMVGFRPIVLTLAVISLELEQMTQSWLYMIHTVQQMAQVEVDSLIRCREIAAQILKDKNVLPTGYKFKTSPTGTCGALARSRSFKRKVDLVDVEDDVYDGIKRLYNEDQETEKGSLFTTANPVCAK